MVRITIEDANLDLDELNYLKECIDDIFSIDSIVTIDKDGIVFNGGN